MDILEPSQQLIEEELHVVVGQRLIRLNDLCQIRLHELGNNVDLIERLSVLGLQNPLDPQDVLVLEQPLDLELSVGPQRKNSVLECFDNFLDGHEV